MIRQPACVRREPMTENSKHRPATEHPALQLSLFEPTLHLVLCDGKRAIERGWQLRMPTAAALDAHVHRGGDLGYIPASVKGLVVDVDTGPDSGPVVQLLGDPVETTVSMGDGRHLLYLAPVGYVPATNYGKGKFRLGDVAGDWIHHGSYAVETWTGWRQLADADWSVPVVSTAVLDTLVQCGRADHVVPVTAAGSRIRNWGLYGDGPLYQGIRAVGLLYRLNVEAGRLLAAGRFEGDGQMLKLARRLDMAYCRPRLPFREVERYGRSVARYWRRRARDGDNPAWLESVARCRASSVRSGTGKGSRARSSAIGHRSTIPTPLRSSRACSPWDSARKREWSTTHTSYSSSRLETMSPSQSCSGGRRTSAKRCASKTELST